MKAAMRRSDDVKLMEEDDEDAQRTDETRREEEHGEDSAAQGAAIGDFIKDRLLGKNPAHVDAGEESACGEQDVGREIIEEIEQLHAEEPQPRNGIERERTERTHHDGA